MSIPGACVLVARFPGAGVAAVKALPGEVDSVLGAWVRKGQQGNGGFAVAVV